MLGYGGPPILVHMDIGDMYGYPYLLPNILIWGSFEKKQICFGWFHCIYDALTKSIKLWASRSWINIRDWSVMNATHDWNAIIWSWNDWKNYYYYIIYLWPKSHKRGWMEIPPPYNNVNTWNLLDVRWRRQLLHKPSYVSLLRIIIYLLIRYAHPHSRMNVCLWQTYVRESLHSTKLTTTNNSIL